MKLLALLIITFLISACAGTVKTYDATTGKKITSTPAGVAVIQAASNQMDDCPDTSPLVFSVDEIIKLSASAQAEAVRNIPMLMALSMLQKDENNCYSQVAKATQAFFISQSTKYRQWGTVGKVGLIGGFSYLAADSLFGALATGGVVSYTTNVGNRSVGSGSGGGSGSVSASGDSRLTDLTINNGGNYAAEQGQVAIDVDKNMNATFKESNSNLDGNGNPSGIVIDDRGDGSGNTGKFLSP